MLKQVNHSFFKGLIEIDISKKDTNKNKILTTDKIKPTFSSIINFIYNKYDKEIVKKNIKIDFNQRIGRYGNCSLVSKDIIKYIIDNNYIQVINEELNIQIKKIGLVKIDTILLNNIWQDTYHVAVILVYDNGYIFLDFSGSQFNYLIHDKKQWLSEFYIGLNIYPKIFKDKTVLPIYEIKYKNNNIQKIKQINELERISPYTSYNILERFDNYIKKYYKIYYN